MKKTLSTPPATIQQDFTCAWHGVTYQIQAVVTGYLPSMKWEVTTLRCRGTQGVIYVDDLPSGTQFKTPEEALKVARRLAVDWVHTLPPVGVQRVRPGESGLRL